MEATEVFARNLTRAKNLLALHGTLHGHRGRPQQHTSDVVRAALVFGVAGLDAYVHQRVEEMMTPGVMANPSAELVDLAKSLAKDDPAVILNAAAAPNAHGFVREALVDILAKRTFQHPGSIQEAFQYVGIPNIWADAAQVVGAPEGELRKQIAEYVQRRHQIVHEGDLLPSGAARGITRGYAEACLNRIEAIVSAMDTATGGDAA